VSIAAHTLRGGTLREHICRDFFATAVFEQNVSRDTVKVTRGIADVASLNLRQTLHYPIDGFVRIVLGITHALGHKDAYQSGANHFIALTCFFAVRIEPFKQFIKWSLRGGQLFTSSSVLGIERRVVEPLHKTSSEAGLWQEPSS